MEGIRFKAYQYRIISETRYLIRSATLTVYDLQLGHSRNDSNASKKSNPCNAPIPDPAQMDDSMVSFNDEAGTLALFPTFDSRMRRRLDIFLLVEQITDVHLPLKHGDREHTSELKSYLGDHSIDCSRRLVSLTAAPSAEERFYMKNTMYNQK